MPKGSAKLTVTALRSLLGFLHVEGEIGEPLGQGVPVGRRWRLAGLPPPLEPEQVDALLAGCDRRTRLAAALRDADAAGPARAASRRGRRADAG